jgi:hypothetical protein
MSKLYDHALETQLIPDSSCTAQDITIVSLRMRVFGFVLLALSLAGIALA